MDRGVNYLNWCGHEDGLSRFLRQSGGRRASLVVAAQFQARTAEQAKRELASVCESLGGMPDILTLYYVESQEEWASITCEGGAWEELARRRRGGPLAMIGLTTHQRLQFRPRVALCPKCGVPVRPSFAPAKEFQSSEQLLCEVIEVVAPVGGVVAVAVHVPDVRHAVFLEIGMHALADPNQAILVPA